MFEFLNLPAVRFKKSKLTREELKRFFITREHDLFNSREKIIDALNSGDDELVGKLQGKAKLFISDYQIGSIASQFTEKDTNKNILINRLKGLKVDYPQYITDYLILGSDHLRIVTVLGDINIYKLSEVYPEVKALFPNIEDESRKGNCHKWAVKAIKELDFSNYDVKIATGFTRPFSSEERFLHSWIEVETNTEPYVLDLAFNLCCTRKAYNQFRNIKGPVYKISKKTFEREADLFDDMCHIDPNLSKLYLSNRHQAKVAYKKFVEEIQKLQEEDPIYQAAKHMHDSWVKDQKQKQRNKNSKGNIEQSQMGE